MAAAPAAKKDLSVYEVYQALGLNAKQRERLKTFQRLSHLTGISGDNNASEQLASLVLSDKADNIVSAREKVAGLLQVAKPLQAEAQYLLDHPEEAEMHRGNEAELAALRDELLQLCRELEARAGEPEPMKTPQAEKMRQKLEARLLPKLNAEIPRWGERLRLLHSEVMKWSAPARLYTEESLESGNKALPEAPPAAPEEEELPEWDAPPEFNPKPKGEELELLKSLGWTPPED